MKHILAVAAAAGILIWGCTPRPQSQGGTFDSTLTAPQSAPADESGLRYLPPGTVSPRHDSPGEMAPGTGDLDEQNPELMLPHHRNQVLHI